MLAATLLAIQATTSPLPLGNLHSAVEMGIDRGVYPGAVLVVGTSEAIIESHGFGNFTWDAGSKVPDSDSTLFDLASLTKVVATTAAVMRLVETDRLDLDSRVSEFIPEFTGEGKERVTVRQLLDHSSGMRSFLSLPDMVEDATAARGAVLEEPLRFTPGRGVIYSDLNIMILGWVIEAVTGESLGEFARAEIFEPLHMMDTQFRPSRSLRGRIMPVGLWRGHVIAGELHDQNAVILGGVSGHAGLYSTGSDLARFAQEMLKAGLGRTSQLFSEETVLQFTARRSGDRALGWEMNDTTSTGHTGQFLSPSAYGHGGYTGGSIWIDPGRDLFVILLTNRVFAPRTGRSISALREIRGEVADAAVRVAFEGCELVASEIPASVAAC